MNALEDEEVQKKGFVIVGYYVGSQGTDRHFREVMKHGRMLQDALPHRTPGVHFCFDDPRLRPLALFVQNVMSKDYRLRFRIHYGS